VFSNPTDDYSSPTSTRDHKADPGLRWLHPSVGEGMLDRALRLVSAAGFADVASSATNLGWLGRITARKPAPLTGTNVEHQHGRTPAIGSLGKGPDCPLSSCIRRPERLLDYGRPPKNRDSRRKRLGIRRARRQGPDAEGAATTSRSLRRPIRSPRVPMVMREPATKKPSMSMIYNNCALVGARSALIAGTARRSTVRSITNSRQARVSTASPTPIRTGRAFGIGSVVMCWSLIRQ
jgi:hypothetical protein